ncbi:MAG: histidine--tRNA ligase [Succinivibrio dextrinosolvens]|nr:histidine--tRNA ligase [Succinivibrio dextrinosolvens]
MAAIIQAIRGMNDLLPEDTSVWQQVEKVLRSTMNSYGYDEVRMPIVEKTNLFCRAIGEVTDVVEKEMYSFEDRSGDNLSLRPEGTAGCVRACLEHSLIYNQEQRLWYMGPMFRHERPQKGRYRQFHQMGVEVFGLNGPDIDAELISLTYSIWKKFGIENELELQLNSLGSAEERAAYREELVKFLEAHYDELDEDCQRRTHTNPLRVLDTKDPKVIEILKDAPKLSDFFGEETRAHFDSLRRMLDNLGIKYVLNDRLVRGLDYYNLTVFEWVTTALGAQGTVCGGGRYDSLVEQLGGAPTRAVGFGIGLERLILLLTTLGKIQANPNVDVYVVGSGENSELKMLEVSSILRENLPSYRIRNHCGGGNFKKQFKKADKCGAKVAVIIGENEIANNTVTVKDMLNQDAPQVEYPVTEAAAAIKELLNK